MSKAPSSLFYRISLVILRLTSFIILFLVSINAFRHFQVPYPFYISFFTLNFVNAALFLGNNAVKRTSTFENDDDDQFCRIKALNNRIEEIPHSMLRVLMIVSKVDMGVLGFSYVNAMITEVAKWNNAPTFFYGIKSDLGDEHIARFAGSIVAVQFIYVTSFVNAWINSL